MANARRIIVRNYAEVGGKKGETTFVQPSFFTSLSKSSQLDWNGFRCGSQMPLCCYLLNTLLLLLLKWDVKRLGQSAVCPNLSHYCSVSHIMQKISSEDETQFKGCLVLENSSIFRWNWIRLKRRRMMMMNWVDWPMSLFWKATWDREVGSSVFRIGWRSNLKRRSANNASVSLICRKERRIKTP